MEAWSIKTAYLKPKAVTVIGAGLEQPGSYARTQNPGRNFYVKIGHFEVLHGYLKKDRVQQMNMAPKIVLLMAC